MENKIVGLILLLLIYLLLFAKKVHKKGILQALKEVAATFVMGVMILIIFCLLIS